MPTPPSPPDYDRLRVFSYTVEINAPTYRAIMAVFAATKARFKLQLRSDDLRRTLEAQGLTIPENGLEPALDQLVEWGNLVRAHDTRRVATLSDFYRRHYVYRITPAGEAAEVAIGAVVAAMHRSGSLQKVMLGTIARRLASVVAELREPVPDPSTLYGALFDLTHQFESLAENASTFMAKLHEALEMTAVNTTAWIAYKQDVIAYLQDFIGELSRSAPQTTELLEELRQFGLGRLCAIAAEADQAPTLDGEDGDGNSGEVERLAARLRGVCEWFLLRRQNSVAWVLIRPFWR